MDQTVESKSAAEQKPGMKKPVKIALYAVGGLVAIGLLLLISLPLWISPVATSVAGAVVPSVTGCEFKLEKFNLNPFTGRVRIIEAHLSNPKGYKEPEAFNVATVNVQVATCSLLTSTIHVKDITIQGPFVGITSENGTNNFMAILANVQEKLGTSKSEPEEKKEAKDEDKGVSKKIIIDHFELSGTRVKLGMLPISIPSVTLNDIGKSAGGVTFAEAGTEIMNSCSKFVTDVGGNAANMLKGAGSGVSEKASDATKALGSGAKSAAEGLKKLNPFGK